MAKVRIEAGTIGKIDSATCSGPGRHYLEESQQVYFLSLELADHGKITLVACSEFDQDCCGHFDRIPCRFIYAIDSPADLRKIKQGTLGWVEFPD